jgi:ABC-type branched-subunit amino acid transport system ATPase component
MLEARNVTKEYGHILALSDLSLSIPAGTIVGLIGPNGSGKTTFIDLVTGFSKPSQGELFFKGERIGGRRPHEISRLGIARTFQETRVFKKMTVLENLLVAGRGRSSSIERARDQLKWIGLSGLEDRQASALSYGQQKLLEFVRTLMSDPAFVLLDEPTAGISPFLTKRMLESFRALRDKGKTLVIVEHNMDVISSVCERAVVLHHGQKIAEGTPAEIQRDSAVQDAYLGGG